ncbi:MAG: hypothetical protein LBH59_09835 [Planctomycetaceae bacterium]|nr:hypothetical protein [Planctomycetaceae bacterium]
MKYQIFLYSLVCMFCVIGCGLTNNNSPVSGKITFEDGTPVNSGEVIFALAGSDSYFAKGTIGSDGTYSLKEQVVGQESNKTGCKKGDFKVFIAGTSISVVNEKGTTTTTHIIDQNYASQSKTPLKVSVPDGVYDFKIPTFKK